MITARRIPATMMMTSEIDVYADGVATALTAGAPELVRNTDISSELKRMSESADFEWITAASDRLAEVERGMRRNLLRSLSLDAFAAALEKG